MSTGRGGIDFGASSANSRELNNIMCKVLFVTAMRLGDSLMALPIASWYYKTYNIKVDWAVENSTGNPYHGSLIDILNKQSCVDKIHLFDFKEHSIPYKEWLKKYWAKQSTKEERPVSCWRPYNNISKEINNYYHNEYNKVFCFGYDREEFSCRRINKYFSEHLAEEHNLEVDYDFTLNYGPANDRYKNNTIKIDKLYDPLLKDIDADDDAVLDSLLTPCAAHDLETSGEIEEEKSEDIFPQDEIVQYTDPVGNVFEMPEIKVDTIDLNETTKMAVIVEEADLNNVFAEEDNFDLDFGDDTEDDDSIPDFF